MSTVDGSCARVTPRPVTLPRRRLDEYARLAVAEQVEEARALGEQLRGLRVVHVSATDYGGGVAEVLRTLVPLMRDVGVDCEWRVIEGDERFFRVTKRLHHALQGERGRQLGEPEWKLWERVNEANARRLSRGFDVAVVHDPQPLPIAAFAGEAATNWIWRCHLDLSAPDEAVLRRASSYLDRYNGSVFHLDRYVPANAPGRIDTMAPAIDPLAAKNLPLMAQDAAHVCAQFGIDRERPLLCQVSRFDRWKDPLGVIDMFELVARERPDAQLALVGATANDDPEGAEVHRATVERAATIDGCHVFSDADGVGSLEVNAFQSRADVLVQKSRREGFGLTVSEALWKARPFVGAAVGGIPLQVRDGSTGFLVDGPERGAARVVELLDDPGRGRELGCRAKEDVRRRFLMPRLLRDWLRVLTRHVRERQHEPPKE